MTTFFFPLHTNQPTTIQEILSHKSFNAMLRLTIVPQEPVVSMTTGSLALSWAVVD